MSRCSKGNGLYETERKILDRADAPDDRQLVAQVQQGSEAGFRRLYRKHSPRLYQLALRLAGGDEYLAEEALQKCWIAAVRSLGRFRWEAELSTWLGGIVVRKVQDGRRRLARQKAVEVYREPEHTDSSVDALPVGALLDLERAIALLAEGQRTVFVLHDIEGYTHEEIGSMLQISAGTSKSQLHDAKCSLRKQLASWVESDEGEAIAND